MGHIKEPVDFFVENKAVSEVDRKQISEIIAHYKATGRKKVIINKTNFHHGGRSNTPNTRIQAIGAGRWNNERQGYCSAAVRQEIKAEL